MKPDTIITASEQNINSIPFLEDLSDENASLISGGNMASESFRSTGSLRNNSNTLKKPTSINTRSTGSGFGERSTPQPIR